jgi:hypothetical protein
LQGQRDEPLSTEIVQPLKSLAWRGNRHLAPTTNRESILIPRYHQIAAIGRLHAAEFRLYISAALTNGSFALWHRLEPCRCEAVERLALTELHRDTSLVTQPIRSTRTLIVPSYHVCMSVLTIPSQVKSTPSKSANFDQPCTTNPSRTRQESLAIMAPFTCRDDTTTISSSRSA